MHVEVVSPQQYFPLIEGDRQSWTHLPASESSSSACNWFSSYLHRKAGANDVTLMTQNEKPKTFLFLGLKSNSPFPPPITL